MIIDKYAKGGTHTGIETPIDEDRFAWVGSDGDGAILIVMRNGEEKTRMALTTEAAWALWWSLTHALTRWGGECPIGDDPTTPGQR